MKRFILIFIFLFTNLTFVYAAPAIEEGSVIEENSVVEEKSVLEEHIALFLDGEALEFETQPILINNQVMVPMRPFFESLGAQVSWVEETRTVVAYKSNMFIKLTIDSTNAYKNGKVFALESPPIIRDNRTLVPAQFIAETFDMESTWIKEGEMNLVSETGIPQYYRFGDYFYKKQSFDQYGISFSIPNYWDRLGSDKFLYGVQSLENTYTVEFVINEETPTSNVDQYSDELQLQLSTLYGDVVTFEDRKSINFNSLNGYSFKSTFNMFEGVEYKIYYLFHDGIRGYAFICNYTDTTAENELKDIFNNVVSTFHINKISIDSKDEHYIEHPEYFNLNVNLDQEIHSNMEVRSSFPFSGTLTASELDAIYVRISKGSSTMYSKIQVDESGQFTSIIYTPFGLGKHDICVMKDKEDCIDVHNGIMQFSVVNLSSDKIRYIIPSEHVSSDNEYVISQSKLITYKATSDYSKAKNIYDWITSELTFESISSAEEHRDSERVYFEKKGSDEEITHLYAAMLRSIGIPTRIRIGKVEGIKHNWVEASVNGKWILSDPVNAMRYGNIDIANQELYANYFTLDLDHYNGLFSSIVTAPY